MRFSLRLTQSIHLYKNFKMKVCFLKCNVKCFLCDNLQRLVCRQENNLTYPGTVNLFLNNLGCEITHSKNAMGPKWLQYDLLDNILVHEQFKMSPQHCLIILSHNGGIIRIAN